MLGTENTFEEYKERNTMWISRLTILDEPNLPLRRGGINKIMLKLWLKLSETMKNDEFVQISYKNLRQHKESPTSVS